MTREEMLNHLEIMSSYPEYPGDGEALDMAIAALKAEPCEDAISRQAVLDAVKNNYRMAAIDSIEKLPPVTPKPRTGKWNDYYTSQKGNDVFNCKLCGATFIVTQGKDDMNFCPNCGAKMGGMSKCRTV